MSATNQIEIRLGLPELYRHRAAELYYEAFQQELESIMGSQRHGMAILEKSFDAEFAIVALHRHQLVGVLGLEYDGHCFVDFRASTFAVEFGWLHGLFKFVHFLPFTRRQRKGELGIDSLVVHPLMRGKEIGTRLLETVFAFARTKGFDLVSLEVVDTNPEARRLYERMGFAPIKTRRYAYLRRTMGFPAATTMIKKIA
jgi:GNAT superfamily N-acetyltransferase